MKQKVLLFFISLSMLSFTACSSYPDSAEGVAEKICQEFHAADLESMKVYMSSEAIVQMKERQKYLDKFFKSPEFIEMKKSSDCSQSTQTKQLDHDRLKIYFGDQLKVKVKVIDGQWKMVI